MWVKKTFSFRFIDYYLMEYMIYLNRSITRVSSVLSFSAYTEGFNRNEISTFWNISMSKGFMGPLVLDTKQCRLILKLVIKYIIHL